MNVSKPLPAHHHLAYLHLPPDGISAVMIVVICQCPYHRCRLPDGRLTHGHLHYKAAGVINPRDNRRRRCPQHCHTFCMKTDRILLVLGSNVLLLCEYNGWRLMGMCSFAEPVRNSHAVHVSPCECICCLLPPSTKRPMLSSPVLATTCHRSDEESEAREPRSSRRSGAEKQCKLSIIRACLFRAASHQHSSPQRPG